ncbi:MAG TPA: hypothetical protein VGA13_11750 [Acidimicrobiales bacterium]
MAQNDTLKQYLDAGIAFTQMTQARAEGIVKNLVQTGEVTREQTQARVDELIERSRKNTEKLLETVRKEIRGQLSSRGFATKADIERLEKKIARLEKATAKPAKKRSSTKKAAATKTSS